MSGKWKSKMVTCIFIIIGFVAVVAVSAKFGISRRISKYIVLMLAAVIVFAVQRFSKK